MTKSTRRYWILQILGWGGWSLINLFFVYFFASELYFTPPEKKYLLFRVLFIEAIGGIASTHLLRLALKRLEWIKLPSGKIIFLFFASIIATSFCFYYASKYTALATSSSIVEYEKKEDLEKAIQKEKVLDVANTTYYLKLNPVADSLAFNAFTNIKTTTGWYRNTQGNWQYEDQHKGRFWWDLIFTFILVALWLSLYMGWQFVEKNRKDQLDRLQLEKNVKELEIKTIKSHINPHFIFNSLNSIRALVDENPERARTAITELSNILRSSMQSDKMETVPLNKELNIVKDYLALEQMRFEERLKIEMDIDQETLDQDVPPMMLQTLVENAIKHGISKRMDGGLIKVISRFTNNNHELIVQNTGQLNGHINGDGFGIKSTRDRLRFLYQGKASFNIKNIDDKQVESKVTMPLSF